jgi:hypothetical protein
VLEVNPVYLFLLAEGFGLLLLILCVWLVITLLRRRRKSNDLVELATQIKQRAPIRAGGTADFLQAVYHFEAEQLRTALESIETAETIYFQHLVDSLEQGESSQVTTLDTALEQLIDTYKCLQPVKQEVIEDPLVREVEEARTQNQELREELSLVRNQMSQLVAEFSDMFGGGQDTALTIDEVMGRLSMSKNETQSELPQVAQK